MGQINDDMMLFVQKKIERRVYFFPDIWGAVTGLSCFLSSTEQGWVGEFKREADFIQCKEELFN